MSVARDSLKSGANASKQAGREGGTDRCSNMLVQSHRAVNFRAGNKMSSRPEPDWAVSQGVWDPEMDKTSQKSEY